MSTTAARPLLLGRFEQVDAMLDEAERVVWLRLHSRPVQCYSLELLDQLKAVTDRFLDHPERVRYLVLASGTPGVFNFGGDLALFSLLRKANDRVSLREYGQRCLERIFFMMDAPDQGIISIALVQGDALGGGLESALSAQVLVAERGTQMGFPETLFNLFPGMGAWQFVTRKAGAHIANKMIMSGDVYRAEQLFEWGLVDVLAEPGRGEQAVRDYVRGNESLFEGRCAAYAARNAACPLDRTTFDGVVDRWATSAVRLADRDRRLMERLVRAQLKKIVGSSSGGAVEAVQIEARAAHFA